MPLRPTQRARLQASAACVGGLVLWWRLGGRAPAVFAGFLASLALLAWVSPPHYAPIQRFLDRVLHLVLAGLTWILLALIYGGLFVPVRCWRALTGRDPLQRRPDPGAATYLRPLPPAAPGRFDRQF
jgi:hypothetical protein